MATTFIVVEENAYASQAGVRGRIAIVKVGSLNAAVNQVINGNVDWLRQQGQHASLNLTAESKDEENNIYIYELEDAS